MSEKTKIEWCDHTFNPWEGCQKVGPGCDHCYAEARNARFSGGTAINWGPSAPRRRTSAANWKLPVKWNRQFELRQGAWDKFVSSNPGMNDKQLVEAGFVKPKRPRVFCASLADVFDNAVSDDWRADLFDLIAATPNLDWLLLTKRIGNVETMVPYEWTCPKRGWPANVWLGATIVNQEEADRDIAKLLALPAQIRFLSMEPLLGPVNLRSLRIGNQSILHRLWGLHPDHDQLDALHPALPSRIDWVISGGESGPAARALHPDWERSLRDQCQDAGVPFHFKQWGEWHTKAFQMSTGAAVFRKFDDYQQWVSKPQWISGGICLDRHGAELKSGGDMARARDSNSFPVTIMHKVGKKAAGRLLDGVQHDGFPESE